MLVKGATGGKSPWWYSRQISYKPRTHQICIQCDHCWLCTSRLIKHILPEWDWRQDNEMGCRAAFTKQNIAPNMLLICWNMGGPPLERMRPCRRMHQLIFSSNNPRTRPLCYYKLRASGYVVPNAWICPKTHVYPKQSACIKTFWATFW